MELKGNPRRNKKAMFHVKHCLFYLLFGWKRPTAKDRGALKAFNHVLSLPCAKKRAEGKKKLKRAVLLQEGRSNQKRNRIGASQSAFVSRETLCFA